MLGAPRLMEVYEVRQRRSEMFPTGPRARAPRMIDLQRSRILRAAVEVAGERGPERTPVGAIVAGAGVSRKTFYDLFDNRDDCILAVIEQGVELAAREASRAYEAERERGWAAGMRAALVALLGVLEDEPDTAALALQYLVGGGPRDERRRLLVLASLEAVVDEGRLQAKVGAEFSPLTAEGVVAGALAILERRVRTRGAPLTVLVNDLMWMIVLPYVGPSAASGELRGRVPKPVAKAPPREPAKDALEGLDMRVTYRTASVLAAVAELPGGNNLEIGARAGIVDQGQISKLLARLARLGLIENTGAGQPQGAANSWLLTPRGEQVERAIGREFAVGRSHGALPTAGVRRRVA